ncbi:MAG: sigma-70 family RNA polymerase sigma factor [Candidatus Eisenbacteria sp.]|nr:sigma-70 family RNA polymerase sigma factor [Candidatus Eisenbacteria bacterium]
MSSENVECTQCWTFGTQSRKSLVVDEEKQWIEQCLDGDESGYQHLLDRYRRGIYNLAYRMLGSAEDANDAAQEAFIKAFRSLDKYDPRFKFSSWLYRIATNHCVDALRKRKGYMVSLEEHEEEGRDLKSRLPGRNPDPADYVHRGERKAIMTRAINQLDPRYRSVILLRHDQEMTYEEMSSILGLPIGTVKVRVHRARQRLRDLLAPFMDDL